MAHQVLITFDINEEKVQENAEKEAGRIIAKDLYDDVFASVSQYHRREKLEQYVTTAIEKILEPHKDEIIQQAIKNVTESLNRSKAVREAMKEALNN